MKSAKSLVYFVIEQEEERPGACQMSQEPMMSSLPPAPQPGFDLPGKL